MATRRNAGACQPIHRWYSVGGGLAVIAAVLPMPLEGASSCRRSYSGQNVLAACLLLGRPLSVASQGSLTCTDAEWHHPHLIAPVIPAASRGPPCTSRGPLCA
jgi:hypothetical protein